ncbi:MAG: gamma-glutamyl-phosphate reductase, partial [candidate division FCPU426 bacterium]
MVQTQKLEARIRLIAEAAKEASRQMANASTGQKNRVLKEMATGLRRSKAAILKANAKDMAHAAKAGLSKAMLDRLMLDDARVEAMASAVLKLVSLPDPVGKRLESRTLKNGLKLEKVRCPLGVVGIVYESRPNVTIDAAALCL